MSSSADLFRLSQFSLGVAIAFLIVGVLPQQLLANEERLNDSTEEERRNSVVGTASTYFSAQNRNISYAASDLQLKDESGEEQQLAREVDIDTFCRSYPLNSRCANYQPPKQRQ